MKIYISASGLYEPIKYIIDDAQSDLTKAMRYATNSPSSFRYASYVNSLDSKIREYVNELKYIENAIRKSESRYSEEFSDFTRKIDFINEVKIPDRTGIQI